MNSVLEEDFEKICSMYSELFEQLKGGRVLITGACGMITSYLSLLLISVMKRYDLTLYLQARNISNLQKKWFFRKFVESTEKNITIFADFVSFL